MKRGTWIAFALVGFAFLLLASLYWYNQRSGQSVSAANLLTVEAGKLLGAPAKASAIKLDLNQNGVPETVYYVPASADTGLHHVRSLVVLELQKRKPATVLLVSREGMFSGGSQRIVDQQPADAYRIQVMQGGAGLRLQLLDANAQAVSDDIALRWDAASGHLKAE